MRHRSLVAPVGLVALLALSSCDWNPLKPDPAPVPPSTTVNVTNQTTVNVGTTPNASPTTAAPGAGGLVLPASVRVGVYGQSCPREVASRIPDNAENAIVVGCTADFTATPKRADGSMQTPAEHGTEVAWSISGAACRDTNAESPNSERFNRAIVGAARGTCVVCATVQGVTGCAVQTPSGDRIVRVVDPY
jgi:hypothetical protein